MSLNPKVFKSSVLEELSQRGFIKDCTDAQALDEILSERKITLYTGYDLTANSLHAGNLMTLMLLRIFEKHGHSVITLLGGATTKIGDPTGRDTARPILTDAQIATNLAGISKNFGQVLKNPTVVNNYDWLSNIEYLTMLQNVGRHFTIDRMSAMDSVTLRMEKGITLTEFNYMVMQAYDFLHLYNNHNCILQVGGSDQWGNIIQGVELIRRIHFEKSGTKAQGFGLTCPLITRADGSKMGKSLDGAVWLSREKLSHFEYFQYFRNIADDDIEKFLRFFTELPLPEVQRLSALKGKEVNHAKKILAFEATKIVHGENYANEALQSAEGIFEKSATNVVMEEVSVSSCNILDVMVQANFTQSKGEAKKLISQNALKINDATIMDISHQLQSGDIIKVGKKKVVRVLIA